ncbi:ArsR/SmtB family transcription factor [Amycolatopsis thermophila]|uniref:DNA-binding transcriptional ArsR family regulator n=1 Tax=Amycolatopsis thermophila TaxID=206084 RepID=A0ABU0F369_9PSEU|nr:helix-turn-helix domain-containing protein [Amycolatopsis thermophila]MDQ0381789.1 DNA-binding transcriptional ArsR family regulator [Amycolatopsis thermophila]
MAELPPRRRVRDAELMRALAHPLRSALLSYLMAVGPRTATDCAEAVESSASNCSWHLRQLAQWGLVERVEATDGRERPWRAVPVGLDFGEFATDPAVRTAQLAEAAARLTEDGVLGQRFLDTIGEFDRAWQEASVLNTYALRITPEELAALNDAIDALVRPYVATLRADAPEGARPVHGSWRAFPRVEASGRPSE